jgi:hypothetical protein
MSHNVKRLDPWHEMWYLDCYKLTIFFGAPSITTVFFECFITIAYTLHVSAPKGHLQLEYIYCLFPKELFFL